MDMEWPYEDEPVYGYSRAIRRVRRLCRQSGGRIVPFVAFDAYRPDSLRLVQDAVQHQSFVGVKFYAPSGYRPDTNTRTILARADVAPTELDRRCAALIEWCAGNDIPIMAHCTPQGMEVAPDQHSGFNAAPEFWEAWLAKLPDLRLCFAHAGGHGHWFPGVPDQKDRPPTFPWSTKIIELCTTNPNVYTDLSHMGDILGDEQAAFFARTLSEDLAANAGRPFSLSTKIVYGTDFPMPLPSGGWQHYYRRMMDTIRGRPELAPLEAGIFRNNAVVFLGLGNFIDQRGGDLTPEQKRHLEGYRDPGPKGSSGVGHVRRPSRPSPK
jgi:predicted TIM-barrel fold metal-dependent hydrolase